LHHKKQKKGRYTPGKGGYNTGIITVSCHGKFSFLVCKKFLGSGEALPRLRGGNGSAPGSNRFGSGEEKKGLSDSISLSLREYLLIAK
jgi:hypothetical protein